MAERTRWPSLVLGRPARSTKEKPPPLQGEGGRTNLAPQTGQCTNRVSLWEHGVGVRVVVRIPCEEAFEDSPDLVLAAPGPMHSSANVGLVRPRWAPPRYRLTRPDPPNCPELRSLAPNR